MARKFSIVVVLFGLSVGLVKSDQDLGQYGIEQFQYPCYVDICTFPTQFCNSDRFERRCSPCTKAICRERKVPLACKYICRINNIPPTTTISTTTHKKLSTKVLPSSNQQSKTNDFSSAFLLLAYSAISTTIILVVLVIILLCVLQRKSQAKKVNKITLLQGDFKSGEEFQDEEQQKSLLSGVTSGLVGLAEQGIQPSANDSPPSYVTDANNGNDGPLLEVNAAQATDHVPDNSLGQASSHVHNGGHGQPSSHVQVGHRQPCSSYTTNPSPDRDPKQHEKPWEVVQGARPKQFNQPLNNAYDPQILTKTQQPESASNIYKNTNDTKQLNNTPNDRNVDHGSHGLPSQGTEMRNLESNSKEDSDRDSEETSLKS